MFLNFLRPSDSFTLPFSNIELPNLVVITGENGSGKSQLLAGISGGAFRLFEWLPSDNYQNEGNWPVGTEAVRLIRAGELMQNGLDGSRVVNNVGERTLGLFNRLDMVRKGVAWIGSEEQYASDVRTTAVQTGLFTKESLQRFENRVGRPVSRWTLGDFQTYSILDEFGDAFNLPIVSIFMDYYVAQVRNQFYSWRLSQGFEVSVPPLSDIEFREQYGPPPWSLVNDALSVMGISYVFDAPSHYLFDPVPGAQLNVQTAPDLRRPGSDIAVSFQMLSGGEKSLVAVALSLYAAEHLERRSNMPKVLLLDEPDSALHPAMMKSLLQFLDQVLVQQLGIRVVLTTHSPTMVALADEESVFVIESAALGEPDRLKKSSKDEALSRLLVGVRALSLNYDHRRVVYVEGKSDVEIYEVIYDLIKSKLDPSVSLQFVQAGGSSTNSRDVVIETVSTLSNLGSLNVAGIIDRDTKLPNSMSERVVCNESRYTLENFIFDPVAVGSLLVRDGFAPLRDAIGGVGYRQLDESHMQRLVDEVSSRVALEGFPLGLIKVKYMGGTTVQLPEFWTTLNGKNLRSHVLTAFPSLKEHQSKLNMRLTRAVWQDIPEFAPRSVFKMFEEVISKL